jgi:SAM-dependent methyltransferase
MDDARELQAFYERAYSREAHDAERYGRWRALSAVGKADHVIALCQRAGVRPQSTLEVGCGDGALLGELAARGFGGRLEGLEITRAAVDIASARSGVDAVALYDGEHIPAGDRAYDLGILSHVLEHVPDPRALLEEAARACAHLVVEVPLENNLSARRPAKRRLAGEVGHLQRLDLRRARELVAAAGLEVEGELADPLPLRVHLFWTSAPAARAAGRAKWALRAAAHALAPALARRLFTVHYACLCTLR